MPIIGKQKVIGVVQLLNNLEGDSFTNADVNAFKLFAVYCALALHFASLFNMLKSQSFSKSNESVPNISCRR
jgi:cAMP and cAMP-inhibited cGMP 3',5'-cyclic phosphodiesterase 10